MLYISLELLRSSKKSKIDVFCHSREDCAGQQIKIRRKEDEVKSRSNEPLVLILSRFEATSGGDAHGLAYCSDCKQNRVSMRYGG